MSYIAQIMCYACDQTLKTVYAQSAPSSSEVSEFNLAGWQEASWISTSGNWDKWVPFCASRLYDGNEQLARTWVIGPRATYRALNSGHEYLPDKTCWVDVTGSVPVVKGDEGVAYCTINNGSSVCGELWHYLSTGGNNSALLCGGC